MVTIPESYRPNVPRWFNRVGHGSIGVLMVVALGLCAFLEPDPSGAGTHTQLGLPGCLISRVTGMERCPSCGLTTAFAHLVRGHLRDARSVHAASPVVFTLWCLVACYCLVVAALGADLLVYEIPALVMLGTAGMVLWLAAL